VGDATIKADHEAAHALLGWYGGFSIKSVTINPRPEEIPGASGICYVRRESFGISVLQTPEMLTAEKVHLLLAGRISEFLFHPDALTDGWNNDFERLAGLMPQNNLTLRMHRYCEDHPHDVEGFYQRFFKTVVRLLKSKKGQRAIKALSRALLEAGTLSGQACVSILEQAWGKPFPPKAKPVSGHFSITEEGPRNYLDLLFNLSAYLRAMEEDAVRLRGNLMDDEEDHLGRIRIHLKMLRLELNAKIKNRGRDHRQDSFKADSLPASRSGNDGGNTPEM
jgi:hypothetical protein